MTVADPVRAIADAVLYEGYVLWPYRRSALKNAQRWTFGGVFPRAHARGARGRATTRGPCRRSASSRAAPPRGSASTVRFLHVVWRQVVDADGRDVDELVSAASAT